jgi:hypothetical protein
MTLGEFGMVLAMIGPAPYVWLIIRGAVRPSRTSWGVWTLILALAIWGYDSAGANDSIWFLVGDFSATAAVFFLSLWRGVGGWTRTDVTCVMLAGLSLLLWQATNIPLFGLWGALIADVIALIPTLIKSLRDPQSEGASAYLFSGLGAMCGFLAVAQWNFSLLFYPAYLFLANMLLAVVVWVGKYQLQKVQMAQEA